MAAAEQLACELPKHHRVLLPVRRARGGGGLFLGRRRRMKWWRGRGRGKQTGVGEWGGGAEEKSQAGAQVVDADA